MSKIVLLPSVAKEYLVMKFAGRRNQKIISMIKFAIVFCLLIFVIGMYAYTVTQASTSGYFLEQARDELAEFQFERSVQELEKISKSKKLRNQMNLHYSDSWSESHGTRFVTVNTSSEYVYRE